MFKPSLKRSKLENISKNSSYTTTATNMTVAKFAANPVSVQKQFSYLDNTSIPLSFENRLQHKIKESNQYIFNPLNFQWNKYPSSIEQSLHLSQQQLANRGMGMYKDILWHFSSNTMIIVNTVTKQQNKFMIPEGSNIVALGQIQNSSLHFRTNGLYIIAIGISNASNNLLLFGIDKLTLKKSQFKQNFTIANSRYIQKIKFINKSQILISSDTVQIYHFDFSSQLKIAHQKGSLLRSLLPVWPLLYPKNQIIQDIQLSQNKVYILISQQRQFGMLTKAKYIMSNFLTSKKPYKNTYQIKRIQVYSLDRIKSEIRLQFKIQEKPFIQRLKNKYVELCQMIKQDVQALKIISIYKSTYNNQQTLSVVLKCGVFVTISCQKEYFIYEIFVTKKQNSLGNVGFSLKKHYPKQEQNSRMNRVRSSLGLKNLTLMNQAIWYLDDNVVEVVKYEGMVGQIQEIATNDLQARKWVIFKDKGFFMITRLTNASIFMGHLLYRNKILQNPAEISYNYQESFQMFLDNFTEVIGFDKICEMLIECLIDDKKTLYLNQWLLEMIGQCLKGSAYKNYRDWHYQLNQTSQQPQQIKQQIKDELWRFLMKYQYKKMKLYGPNQPRVSNAYCNAIRSIYIKLTSSLLSIQACNIKAKFNLIQSHFKIFQKLNAFIVAKKQYQLYQTRSSVMNQSYRYQKTYKRSLQNDYSYQKINKNMEEQSTQVTFDNSLNIQSSRNTQSISHVQQMLLNSLQKIKSLIFVFMHLADLGQNQNLPDLMTAFKSKKQRLKIKSYLIERVNDKDQLLLLSQSCPDFQLEKYLRYKEWHEKQSKYKNLDLLNIKQLAILINSQYMSQIKIIFEDRQDLLVHLLASYMDYLKLQLDNLQRKRFVYNDKRNLKEYTVDSMQNDNNEKMTYLNQQMDRLSQQFKIIQSQEKNVISAFVCKFVKSDETNYKQRSMLLHEVIRVIALTHHQIIYSHLETQLKTNGLIEQIIMLSKMTRKPQKKRHFSCLFENSDIMSHNNSREESLPQQRLSNLEKIFFNFDKKNNE